MVSIIGKIVKVADEAADAAKKAAALAKKRSKAAKKGAKTKAANRKAAEKAKAKRSRAGKKAKKTKDKNIREAEKAKAAEEKAAKKARKEEHPGTKPTQKGTGEKKSIFKKKFTVREGAQEESFRAGQPAAGEGPVTVGKESGDIPNYAKDMMDNLSAKRKTALTKYFKNGESFKGMSAQQKRDAQYALRYVRREADSPSYSARAARAEGGKKAAAATRTDSYDKLLQTGEIEEGFEPTTKQIQQAINNMKARGKTSRVRQLEARLESLDPGLRYGGRKSGPFPGAGRPAGHPSEPISRAGEVQRRTGYQPKELKAEDDMTKLLMRTERPGFKRGGLTKKGHKDYRKGGMFY